MSIRMPGMRMLRTFKDRQSTKESFMKKGFGFYAVWFSVLMAAGALISYLRNCRTQYFASFGVDSKIICLLTAGVLLQIILLIAGGRKLQPVEDVLFIIIPAVYMGALLAFVSARITEAAFIFTFENNAGNMADLLSALAGIAFSVLAVLSSLIAAWFDIRKEVKA